MKKDNEGNIVNKKEANFKRSRKIPRAEDIKVDKEEEQISISESILKVLPFALFATLVPLYKYRIEFVWSKIAVGYLSIALAGLTLVYLHLKHKKITFNIPLTLFPVLILIVYGSLSSFWAINPYKSQNIATMIGPGVLAYFVVQLMRLDLRDVKFISIFIAIASSVVSGYGLLQLIGIFPMPPDQYGNPNPITTFGLSNFAVEYLLLAFPLVVGFAIAERSIIKVLYIISAVVNFLYIFGCKNRAGWVGTFVFFVALGYIYALYLIIKHRIAPTKVLKYAGITVVAIVVIFIFLISFTNYGKVVADRLKSFTIVGPGSSVSTRLWAWRGGLEMIKENPIFGVGGGNYEILSWKYAPRILDEATMITNTRVDKAHNEYIQIFADLGIVGFSIFISIVFLIFKLFFDIFRKTEERDEYYFHIGTGLFLGIFATLAASSFNFALQWQGSAIHFWFFLGLLEVVRNRIVSIKPYEIDIRNRSWLGLLPGGFIFLGALGAPCYNGIPTCKSKFCLDTFICRASPGFFQARNLALAEVYYRVGQFYKRMRNFDISERYYLASLKHENPAERTFYDLAYLYLGASNGVINERVITLLEEVLKLVPNFGKGRRELGRMYIQIGQVDKGIDYVLRSTDSNPANIPEAYAVVANAYLDRGDYTRALTYALMAIEEIDNSPSKKRYGINPIPSVIFDENKIRFIAYFVAGSAYARLKDYDNAERYLNLASSIEPSNPRVIINLSTLYLDRGEIDKAEELLKNFEPTSDIEKASKLFNLASVYAARGNKEKAIEYLQAASSIIPSFFDRAFYDKYLKTVLHGEGSQK